MCTKIYIYIHIHIYMCVCVLYVVLFQLGNALGKIEIESSLTSVLILNSAIHFKNT